MPLASELELPKFDNTDPGMRGERYHAAMASLDGRHGWLAASPFGFIVLDREAGEFFLRTKDAVFPGLKIGELFGISDGPLDEEIVKNIININGEDHRRLRNLLNPALTPRTVDRYRTAMRRFLEQLLAGMPADGRREFIDAFAKPYPSLVIAEMMGAPLSDAPRLHHWSNWIQRQFDAVSLIGERELIEQAVAEFYEYADGLIETRRRNLGGDLITDLISAEEAGERLSYAELRNLVLNVLVGGVDTSQSQLAHAVRLLAAHPSQWRALRADPHGLALEAVDEALRYEPITPFTDRITVAEIEFRGVTSLPARLCSSRPEAPTATAPTRRGSTSSPIAGAPGCSRSALGFTTASAPTSPAPRCRRASRSSPRTSSRSSRRVSRASRRRRGSTASRRCRCGCRFRCRAIRPCSRSHFGFHRRVRARLCRGSSRVFAVSLR
jgi:cytochrome P450